MNDLEWPMLSYYVMYYAKFRKVMHRTEKDALNITFCLHRIQFLSLETQMADGRWEWCDRLSHNTFFKLKCDIIIASIYDPSVNMEMLIKSFNIKIQKYDLPDWLLFGKKRVSSRPATMPNNASTGSTSLHLSDISQLLSIISTTEYGL